MYADYPDPAMYEPVDNLRQIGLRAREARQLHHHQHVNGSTERGLQAGAVADGSSRYTLILEACDDGRAIPRAPLGAHAVLICNRGLLLFISAKAGVDRGSHYFLRIWRFRKRSTDIPARLAACRSVLCRRRSLSRCSAEQ